ncbi:hypothetical protein V1498_19870 [Peribacillus sp. SCS-26]|uniref:hypothetical protein n=1 Tax=Paraperibacillus marinus TaxID=3115295 RepID=UPI00390694A5
MLVNYTKTISFFKTNVQWFLSASGEQRMKAAIQEESKKNRKSKVQAGGTDVYRKNCYKCHRPSFSCSESGSWLCPVCGTDLTNQRLFDAVALEKAEAGFRRFPVLGSEKNKSKRIL